MSLNHLKVLEKRRRSVNKIIIFNSVRKNNEVANLSSFRVVDPFAPKVEYKHLPIYRVFVLSCSWHDKYWAPIRRFPPADTIILKKKISCLRLLKYCFFRRKYNVFSCRLRLRLLRVKDTCTETWNSRNQPKNLLNLVTSIISRSGKQSSERHGCRTLFEVTLDYF
jgi:hypothetical protein